MKNSTTPMHGIIFSLVGVMSVFAVTIPIAIYRVSTTAKFAGQPFNSQTCKTDNPAQRQVVSWLETCRHLQIDPK